MKSMKKGFKHAFKYVGSSVLLLSMSNPVLAATITNTGTGNIAGQSGTLSSGSVSLDVQSLGITKRVYDLAGTELAGANNKVAKGQTVWIVLYVDNTSNATVQDVRVKDNLSDANGDGTTGDLSGFSYVTNSLEFLSGAVASAATPGTSSTSPGWFHTGGNWTAKTDVLSNADEIGVTGTGSSAVITMGGTGVAGDNRVVDLQPLKITAIRFKVTIN